MVTKNKDALYTCSLSHIACLRKAKKLSTSLIQHKAKAKHRTGLCVQAAASWAAREQRPAAAAAAPGSHAQLSQRKRQLLSVDEHGSSSMAFSVLFQRSSQSSRRLSQWVSGL